MKDLSIELINEIDRRVALALNEKNILCRTNAKVVWVSEDQPVAGVVFYGDPNMIQYKLPYTRNNLTLAVGDTVYVESKVNNLNSGIIVNKLFGIKEG